MISTDLDALGQLHEYSESLSRKRVADDPVYKNWQLAKQTVWLSLLVASYLLFYLIDILQQTFELLTVR